MPIVKISIVKMPIIKMPIVKISSISSIVHIHWGRQTFPEPHSRTLKMIVYQNKWVEVVLVLFEVVVMVLVEVK